MVSILMPVKNAAEFLIECLDSIVSQSYRDWELIAINDHSEDETQKILAEYVLKDQRIKTFQNTGKGIIDALCLAYNKSSGDFITRMDADDIMYVDKIKLLIDPLKVSEDLVSTAKVNYFSAEGIGDGYKKYENWLNGLVENRNHYSHIYKECVIPSPCWMTKRENIEKIGGFRSLVYPEDYDLCFKFYQFNISVWPINQTLHKWRDYASRTSRNDPNYADNTFIPLKVNNFINIDLNNRKKLSLWGAGKKGKAIAKLLAEKNISFAWYTNNSNKIGHTISGVRLESIMDLDHSQANQIIFAIADKSSNKLIDDLTEKNEAHQIFEFC